MALLKTKTYSVVLTLKTIDGTPGDDPAKWDWPALIGAECWGWQVWDVTDGTVENMRLTDVGAERNE